MQSFCCTREKLQTVNTSKARRYKMHDLTDAELEQALNGQCHTVEVVVWLAREVKRHRAAALGAREDIRGACVRALDRHLVGNAAPGIVLRNRIADAIAAESSINSSMLHSLSAHQAGPAVDQMDSALSPAQRAVLLRYFHSGTGEFQGRVLRGAEDDHLTELIEAFEAFFVMCRAKFGHDQVPVGIWETYTMIRQRARKST